MSILDTGEYTCTASNVMGAVYSAISIIVEGMMRKKNIYKFYNHKWFKFCHFFSNSNDRTRNM